MAVKLIKPFYSFIIFNIDHYYNRKAKQSIHKHLRVRGHFFLNKRLKKPYMAQKSLQLYYNKKSMMQKFKKAKTSQPINNKHIFQSYDYIHKKKCLLRMYGLLYLGTIREAILYKYFTCDITNMPKSIRTQMNTAIPTCHNNDYIFCFH